MQPLLLVTRDWFEILTGVAQMITALAIVAVAVFAAGTAWAIRGATRGLVKALEGAQGELVPLLKQARAIADDVKGMTDAAAGEVARVRALVEQTTGKAETALAAAESRLRRLDALAGIVQDEAEDAVVSVASAVRGTTSAISALRHDLLGDGAGDDEDDEDDDNATSDADADADLDEAVDEETAPRPRARHRRSRRD
jgi:uncharacterized protein YoxC